MDTDLLAKEDDDVLEYTPAEYFKLLKDKKQVMTDALLQQIYDNCIDLLNKYKITGQKQAMKKLLFHLDNLEKERELIKLGINKFVYKSDIEDYIRNVKDRVVKVRELADYEREIPDLLIETISQVKPIFDKLYVVFTDYTGEIERQVKIEQRAFDPILFGAFLNREKAVIVERFYFIGDWEDDFCDLTLDKLVMESKEMMNKNIIRTIKTPEDIAELKAQLDNLVPVNNNLFVQKSVESSKPVGIKKVINFLRSGFKN